MAYLWTIRSIGLKELWELRWYRSWRADRLAAGTPVWPEWMKNFKDYAPEFISPLGN
jgi:hypothetical protein